MKTKLLFTIKTGYLLHSEAQNAIVTIFGIVPRNTSACALKRFRDECSGTKIIQLF